MRRHAYHYRAGDSAIPGVSEPKRRFIGTTAALIGIAAASAGSSIASAAIQSHAAQAAAKTQAGGTQAALDFAKQMWGQQQQLQAPYLRAGGAAMNQLSALTTPGGYHPGMSFGGPSPYAGMIGPGTPPMGPGGTPPPPPGSMPPPGPRPMGPPNPWTGMNPAGPRPMGY